MTKDEAIHKALKVLNCLNNDRVYETAWVKGAINACEEALEQQEVGDAEIKQMLNDIEYYQKRVEALEQPAQEPVKQKVKVLYEKDGIQTCEILPAPSWQGLSNSEIGEAQPSIDVQMSMDEFMDTFARAIEQALKEKNTP